jgi:hypothetical protein
MLQLYQQEDENTRAASDNVDVSTLFLVKEPYFKVMGYCEYCLRVDHLSDVMSSTSRGMMLGSLKRGSRD